MTLDEFINANELTFEPGERNTNLTVLVGYALSKDLSAQDCIGALEEDWGHDAEIPEEVNRIWKFAESSHYGDWWKTQTEWKV